MLRRFTRHRLRRISIGLGMARLQLQAGHFRDVGTALAQLHVAVQDLRRAVDRRHRKIRPKRRRPRALAGV